MALSETAYKIKDASHQLPVALMEIESHLRDAGISDSELGHGIDCDGELADADDSDSELGYVYDAHAKLADGKHSPGGNGHAIGPVFE
jgi:hypothetical protein